MKILLSEICDPVKDFYSMRWKKKKEIVFFAFIPFLFQLWRLCDQSCARLFSPDFSDSKPDPARCVLTCSTIPPLISWHFLSSFDVLPRMNML